MDGENPDGPAEHLAAEIRRRRHLSGLGRAELAARVGYSAEYVGRAERPRKGLPSAGLVAALDRALDAGGVLIDLRTAALTGRRTVARDRAGATASGDELLQLATCAETTDIGSAAVEAHEEVVELLARSYAGAAPQRLLTEVRRRAAEVAALLDGRSTLSQRRRLLVVGGWLALLGATLHVDLGNRTAATTARAAAASLGRETGHPELVAWSIEIATWTALIDQDWPRAAQLAAEGEAAAPRGGSAVVQLAAQAARASARLDDGPAVRTALDRTAAALGRQPAGRPADHHFVLDGRKLAGYTATSLAWLGDPAGERVAREVVEQCTRGPARRLATARIDLGLVVARTGRPDEAGQLGVLAVDSGWVVASNRWRATELAGALAHSTDVAEVGELRERLRAG